METALVYVYVIEGITGYRDGFGLCLCDGRISRL
jgi:hypothetical protein